MVKNFIQSSLNESTLGGRPWLVTVQLVNLYTDLFGGCKSAEIGNFANENIMIEYLFRKHILRYSTILSKEFLPFGLYYNQLRSSQL